jgi:hypothetical protein
MSSDVFGLTGSDYWSDPMRTMRAFAWDRIGDEIAGIVLGGPAEIDLDAHDTLPLLAYHSDTLAEMIRSPFHHAVVVASRIDGGGVLAAAAEIEAPHEPAPPPNPEPGFTGAPHLLDLREIFGIPWTPARWIVRLLLRDQQSNALTLELLRGGERAAAAPAELSLAIQPPPRVVIRAPETEARMRISFRLALTSGVLPLAVPVWLVMIGSARAGLAVQRLDIPPEELEGTPSAPAVNGSIEVDLLRHPSIARSEAQTYFIYAFAGAAMAGPVLMGVVD